MNQKSDETDLIQTYLAPLAAKEGLGLRDDAACFTPKPGMDLVMTKDTIVAGVHFLHDDDPFDIAIKAITVNLSDLVAKGANPVGYLLSLSLPETPVADWMQKFTDGLAEQIQGRLFGGDLTATPGPLSVTVTAIGEVPTGKMVRRKGGKPGDIVFVTGPIGTKYAGLKCVQDISWAKLAGLAGEEIGELARAYAAPMIPFWDTYATAILENATAGMDVSDGLVIDLGRLCAASDCGAEIQLDQIPLHPIVEKLVQSEKLSIVELITGGDDYVALVAVPQAHVEGVRGNGPMARFHEIGQLTESGSGVSFLKSDGTQLALPPRSGFDHFQI